jgi:hypothetical protein
METAMCKVVDEIMCQTGSLIVSMVHDRAFPLKISTDGKRPRPDLFLRCRRADIGEYNLVVELDGIQHFEVVKFFGGTAGFAKRQRADAFKDMLCLKHNVSMLRIDDTVPREDYKQHLLAKLSTCTGKAGITRVGSHYKLK